MWKMANKVDLILYRQALSSRSLGPSEAVFGRTHQGHRPERRRRIHRCLKPGESPSAHRWQDTGCGILIGKRKYCPKTISEEWSHLSLSLRVTLIGYGSVRFVRKSEKWFCVSDRSDTRRYKTFENVSMPIRNEPQCWRQSRRFGMRIQWQNVACSKVPVRQIHRRQQIPGTILRLQ